MQPLHVYFKYGNYYVWVKGVLLAVAVEGKAGTTNSD